MAGAGASSQHAVVDLPARVDLLIRVMSRRDRTDIFQLNSGQPGCHDEQDAGS